jgi:hypothetical protein
LKNISISVRLTFWFSAIFLTGFVAFGIVMWLDLAYSLSHGHFQGCFSIGKLNRALRAPTKSFLVSPFASSTYDFQP